MDLKAGRLWGSRAPFRILADHERARRPEDNVAVLSAVEAQALGGLIVLLRAAGLDVVRPRRARGWW